jgi:hypothetical protein
MAAPRIHGRRGTRCGIGVDPSSGSSGVVHQRVMRRLLSVERGSVRVTTANGCFTVMRPTETAPACLRLEDPVAGTHGSPIVDNTKRLAVNDDLTAGTVASCADSGTTAEGGDEVPSG